jgi:exosortase
MIPLPLPLISSVLFPMKIAVVSSCTEVVRLIGIPVNVQGFHVHLAHGSLVIDNPCSGLRSLIAFASMGALVGHLRVSTWKKGLGVFVLSIPVAFLSNLMRTVGLVVVAHRWGVEAASTGHWFHSFSGMVAFIVGLVLLLCFARLLE